MDAKKDLVRGIPTIMKDFDNSQLKLKERGMASHNAECSCNLFCGICTPDKKILDRKKNLLIDTIQNIINKHGGLVNTLMTIAQNNKDDVGVQLICDVKTDTKIVQ